MPYITKVNLSSQSSAQGSAEAHNFDVTVFATIKFSATERNIGLNYNVKIALYEIDERMDVYSVFPNNRYLFVQHAGRGVEDDFLGISEPISISAQSNGGTVEYRFSVRPSFEADHKMELKALVVCIPETATAMKWSSTKKVEIITG